MDGLLVGRVEHGRMLFGRFEAVTCQTHRGERLIVERLERPCGRLRPITGGRDVTKTLRRGQAQSDRQANIRRRGLRDGGAIAEFHHGMHDGLRMHGHIDAARWHIEQSVCFDDFKTFVHQRGRVDGHNRPHVPCGVVQGLFRRDVGHLVALPAAERTAGRGDDELGHFAVRAGTQRLPDGGMFGIDRIDLLVAYLRAK